MKFSVVQWYKGKEVGRSVGIDFDKALSLCKQVNKQNQDYTWKSYQNCAVVEETISVKHLPITIY